jgi:hypothetical protein
LFGALSDRWGRRPIYGVGVGLAIVWAFAFFRLMDTKIAAVIVLAVIIGLIIHASMWGPQSCRQKRPLVFDPFTPKPAPLVPRERRIGVRERVAYDGSVLLALCEADVLQAAETLRAAGVASIAICFLHSYANPTHERRAAELVRAACRTARRKPRSGRCSTRRRCGCAPACARCCAEAPSRRKTGSMTTAFRTRRFGSQPR